MRSVNFTLTAMGLVAVAGAMAAMLIATTRGAAGFTGHTRSYLFRLAWLSAALLAICLLMLAWVVVRHARQRITRRTPRSETPYVDAWAEAGKRLKLKDEEKDEPDEDGPVQS